MNNIRLVFARLYNLLFPPLEPEMAEGMREVRPFFIMSVTGLVFMYGWSLYFQEHLRKPAYLVPFTLLMLIHGILHLNAPRYIGSTRRSLVFILVQVSLAFILSFMGRNLALTYGMFMSILGESAGFFGYTPLGGFAILLSLGASGVSFVLVESVDKLWAWVLTALPMTAFVLIYVIMYHRQALAREQSQTLLKDLENAHRQLAEYAAQAEELTLAAERQRMARELHDTLSQGLAGLILQLEAASAHLESQRIEKVQNVLEQAMAQARGTLADARRAIGDLREAPTSPSIDLAQAVRLEAAQFQTSTGIHCEVEISAPPDLPVNVRETAMRMVSECLANTARHANAQRAWLRLAAAGKVLYVEAGDDGKGFDKADVQNQSGHYGLLGLRERTNLAGGKLVINSQPGLGTVVRLELPIV